MNEYVPFAIVVVVRLPSETVAPPIGKPPGLVVTVPETVPFPIEVQPGNLKEPMRVRSFKPSVA